MNTEVARRTSAAHLLRLAAALCVTAAGAVLLAGFTSSSSVAGRVVTVSAASPPRVTIALVGDSVVAGETVRPELRLAPAIRAELAAHLAVDTSPGYVPSHESIVRAVDGGVSAAPWQYSGDWRFVGVSPFFASDAVAYSAASPYAADGRAAETRVPGSTAVAFLPGARFAALYSRAPDGGRLQLSVDNRARSFDTRAPRPDGGGIVWVTAPPPADVVHRVAITSRGGGRVVFYGLLVRRARHGRGSVEVLALGRPCECAADRLGRYQRQAIRVLEPDITVLMFGTNEQGRLQLSDDPAVESSFVRGLARRGRVARSDGGRCVVVPPAPNARPAGIQSRVRQLARDAARDARCRYADAFRGLWSGAGSEQAGLTIDGLHPTALGYRVMAARLEPLLRAMVSRIEGRR